MAGEQPGEEPDELGDDDDSGDLDDDRESRCRAQLDDPALPVVHVAHAGTAFAEVVVCPSGATVAGRRCATPAALDKRDSSTQRDCFR